MANEYKQFIDAIDEFDNYSQETIENCEAFKEVVTNLADKAGGWANIIGSFAQDTLINNGNTSIGKALVADVAANYGQQIFSFLGNKLAAFNKNSKYKKAQEQILTRGLEYKESAFLMIPKAIESFDKYGAEVYDEIIDKAKNKILEESKDIDRLKSYKEPTISLALPLLQIIRKMYQYEYRKRLAINIMIYFDSFEEKIKDFEQFSVWYQDEIVINKIDCYVDTYRYVNERVLKGVTDPKDKQHLKAILSNIEDNVPIMYFDNTLGLGPKMDVDFLLQSYCKNEEMLDYETDNIKRLYSVAKEHYETYVKPKIRKLGKTLLLVVPLIVTILTLIITFIVCNVNYMDFSILPTILALCGSELFFGTIYGLNVRSSHKKPLEHCMKVESDELVYQIWLICNEIAEDEKDADTDEIDKMLVNDKSNQIESPASEDDFLNDLISGGNDAEEDLLNDILDGPAEE